MAFNFSRSAKKCFRKKILKNISFVNIYSIYSGGKVPSNKNQTMKCYCSSIAGSQKLVPSETNQSFTIPKICSRKIRKKSPIRKN